MSRSSITRRLGFFGAAHRLLVCLDVDLGPHAPDGFADEVERKILEANDSASSLPPPYAVLAAAGMSASGMEK
jgi:hypothetical protein